MTGAEISQHMCDVAAQAVVMNGYAAKSVMIHKDVRRIHAEKLPDGTLPDMDHRASVCIFEVCACQSLDLFLAFLRSPELACHSCRSCWEEFDGWLHPLCVRRCRRHP